MKDADALRVEAGSSFPTDVEAVYCEFYGDDAVVVANESSKGGTIRCSFSTLSATTQMVSPTTFFNDIATTSSLEANNSAYSSSKSSKGSKKSSKSKSKSAKAMPTTSGDLRHGKIDPGGRKEELKTQDTIAFIFIRWTQIVAVKEMVGCDLRQTSMKIIDC